MDQRREAFIPLSVRGESDEAAGIYSNAGGKYTPVVSRTSQVGFGCDSLLSAVAEFMKSGGPEPHGGPGAPSV